MEGIHMAMGNGTGDVEGMPAPTHPYGPTLAAVEHLLQQLNRSLFGLTTLNQPPEDRVRAAQVAETLCKTYSRTLRFLNVCEVCHKDHPTHHCCEKCNRDNHQCHFCGDDLGHAEVSACYLLEAPA